MQPLDHVRRDLGLPTTSAGAANSLANGKTQASRLGLRDVLDGSVRSTDVPVELGSLGTWSWLAMVLAAAVAGGHRFAVQHLGDFGVNSVTCFLYRCTTFAGIDRWGPWAAGVVAAGLVGAAFASRGFRRARHEWIVTIGVLDVAAAMLAIPLAITVAAAALAAAVLIVLCIVGAVVAFGAVLAALDGD